MLSSFFREKDCLDLGDVNDWILVAFSDAATKKVDHAFSVAGHVVFLVNKVTNNATPITWSSKKIERVVNSSLAAETLAMTKLIGTIYYIKEILKQMHGSKMDKNKHKKLSFEQAHSKDE